MLTFLRNIRRTILSTGATRKYILYALGEFLLIVAGILVAMQINNWNENRLDRRKEKALLKEIHKEFLLNQEELRLTVRGYSMIRRDCQKLIDKFPIDVRQVDRDTLSKYFQHIERVGTPDLSKGSISTLVNTASFDIISNIELRSLLIQFENLYLDLQEKEQNVIDNVKQDVIPYMDSRVPQPYAEGIRDERVDLSFLRSIEFENVIRGRHRWIGNLLNTSRSDGGAIAEAVDRIVELSEE